MCPMKGSITQIDFSKTLAIIAMVYHTQMNR